MVQKEQLAEELGNMKKRFDTYILDTQARLLEERESVRRESQMMIDTINQKVCHEGQRSQYRYLPLNTDQDNNVARNI